MKTRATLVAVSAALTFACTTESSPVVVDISGLEHFWTIVDVMASDGEPEPAAWDSLFATPGYRALTASEFEPSFFRENFRLAFMPSRRGAREQQLESGSGARYLRHYLRVVEERDQLETFARAFERSGLVEPYRLAAEWLPPPGPSEPAPVALVVFAMDGRGYNPIVLDVLAAKESDLTSFLAHEFHHWYRNRDAPIDWERVAPEDGATAWTLYQIQGEGIADMIDKRAWLEGEEQVPDALGGYAEQYLEALRETSVTLGKIDSLLAHLAEPLSAEQRTTIGERLSEIVPMSGHPTGYFMASVILAELGRERLVADVGNPFAFFRMYDEATSGVSGAANLSAGAMRAIRELERRYTVDHAVPRSGATQ